MTNETKQISNGVNKQTIYIAIFLVVIVAAIVAWVVFSNKGTEAPVPVTQTGGESVEGGLGADIAEKAQNPLSDKLPDTNPGAAVNPLEGAYQNPFGE